MVAVHTTSSARRPGSSWGPDAPTAAALVVAVAAVWLVCKALAAWAWVLMPGEYGDTYYYLLNAQRAASEGGIVAALREYPTPAGLLLLAPYELGATHHDSYRLAVMVMTSAADAAFAILLGRRTGPGGVLAWVALTAATGQLALLRFDMLPAVVAGAAVLLAMQGARGAASVLVAVGTGLKLWPIVLAPLAAARPKPSSGASAWRLNRTPLVAFAGTGVLLVVGSLAVGGWARLVSPLAYQRDRGLQIESVPATIPMTVWVDDPAYRVWYSPFSAYEVTGPSVATWLGIAQVATVLAVLGCAALLAWWWARGASPAAIGWVALTFVGAFLVTSRALSPQYLLWLAAPAAVVVGLALAGEPDAPARPADRPPAAPALLTFAAVLALAALTTAVYPVHYGGVTGRSDVTDRAVALLVVRNVGLLAFVAWCAACAVVTSARHGGARAGGNSRPLPARPVGHGLE